MRFKVWRGRGLLGLAAGVVMLGTLVTLIRLQTNRLEAAATTTCNSLAFQLSSDKSQYVFTAKASAASGATITGYAFQFGDRQSYTVKFDKNSKRDRSQAVATHTYGKAGSYAATVSVLSQAGGKTSTITSKNCSVQVVVGQAGSLLNVGPGSMVGLFVSVSAAGTVSHQVWLRRHKFAV